jgi:hypothetical protein
MIVEPSTQINLRHDLLTASREELRYQWEKECEVAFNSAEYHAREAVLPPPPTTEAILALAETYYSFVTKA